MNTRLLAQQDFDTAGQDREEFIKNCCGVVYSGKHANVCPFHCPHPTLFL